MRSILLGRWPWSRSARPEREEKVVVSQTREATDVLALHARAVPQAQRVIDAIRPDQLGVATPCPEWDVRALLTHLTWLPRGFAAAAAGGPPPAAAADLLGDDPKAAFAD